MAFYVDGKHYEYLICKVFDPLHVTMQIFILHQRLSDGDDVISGNKSRSLERKFAKNGYDILKKSIYFPLSLPKIFAFSDFDLH